MRILILDSIRTLVGLTLPARPNGVRRAERRRCLPHSTTHPWDWEMRPK